MPRIATFAVIAVLIAGCGSSTAGTPANQPPAPTLSPAGTIDLSEATRQKIYWDLVVAQDKGVGDEEAYTVVARKHGVTVEMVRKIAVEGSTKLWPIPTAPN